MPPYHVGSNMAHEVDFERATFEHGALKFQAGTPDVAGPGGTRGRGRFFEAPGRRCGVTMMNSCGMAGSSAPKSRACESSAQADRRSRPGLHVCDGRACTDDSRPRTGRTWYCRAGGRHGGAPVAEAIWRDRGGACVSLCLLHARGYRPFGGRVEASQMIVCATQRVACVTFLPCAHLPHGRAADRLVAQSATQLPCLMFGDPFQAPEVIRCRLGLAPGEWCQLA